MPNSYFWKTPSLLGLTSLVKNEFNFSINFFKKRGYFEILKNDKKILENEFESTCPVKSKPGVLYGLPKVHKAAITIYLNFNLFYQLLILQSVRN